MCINWKFAEGGREKLGITIAALCIILATFGISITVVALYIKGHIESKMIVMDRYDPGVVPHLLMAIGSLMFILNGIGAKVAYDCGYEETRGRFSNLLVFFEVILFCFIWIIFSGGIICFSHRGIIEDSLQSGLSSVMRQYKSNPKLKTTMDRLQMEYRCCGSQSYRDWFLTSWIGEEWINIEHSKTKG